MKASLENPSSAALFSDAHTPRLRPAGALNAVRCDLCDAHASPNTAAPARPLFLYVCALTFKVVDSGFS
jgi:hypothetical protein